MCELRRKMLVSSWNQSFGLCYQADQKKIGFWEGRLIGARWLVVFGGLMVHRWAGVFVRMVIIRANSREREERP